MNVVDSSGWLEYFADAANAGFFGKPIADTARLIVPTISLLEVFNLNPAVDRSRLRTMRKCQGFAASTSFTRRVNPLRTA